MMMQRIWVVFDRKLIESEISLQYFPAYNKQYISASRYKSYQTRVFSGPLLKLQGSIEFIFLFTSMHNLTELPNSI